MKSRMSTEALLAALGIALSAGGATAPSARADTAQHHYHPPLATTPHFKHSTAVPVPLNTQQLEQNLMRECLKKTLKTAC